MTTGQRISGVVLVVCLIWINVIQDRHISNLETRISRLESGCCAPAGENR